MSETNTTGPVTELSDDGALSLLKTQRYGRLMALSEDKTLDVFIVNYVVDEAGIIYFRTSEGTKLGDIVLHPTVTFQADDIGEDRGWSVIVTGEAKRVESLSEQHYAEGLPLVTYLNTPKYNWVRIAPDEISGRAFIFEPTSGYEG